MRVLLAILVGILALIVEAGIIYAVARVLSRWFEPDYGRRTAWKPAVCSLAVAFTVTFSGLAFAVTAQHFTWWRLGNGIFYLVLAVNAFGVLTRQVRR